MTIQVLTGEKAAEYQRVYADYSVALAHASDVLSAKGMSSPEFREADAAAGKLWTRLRELRGEAGQHWMA
jgi:hypothetical protein